MNQWIQSIIFAFLCCISVSFLPEIKTTLLLTSSYSISAEILNSNKESNSPKKEYPIDKEEEEKTSVEDENNEKRERESQSLVFAVVFNSAYLEHFLNVVSKYIPPIIQYSYKLDEKNIPLYILFTCLKVDC